MSDNSKLRPASSTRSHNLWCKAKALLIPVALVGKISASKFICYFSSHPEVSGFQVSSPSDNVMLNVADNKT